MSTDCEDTDTMLIDTILIYLCYILGIGSILFGALSGNKYGHHFVVVGVLVIGTLSFLLTVIYCARIIVRYTDNLKELEHGQ